MAGLRRVRHAAARPGRIVWRVFSASAVCVGPGRHGRSPIIVPIMHRVLVFASIHFCDYYYTYASTSTSHAGCAHAWTGTRASGAAPRRRPAEIRAPRSASCELCVVCAQSVTRSPARSRALVGTRGVRDVYASINKHALLLSMIVLVLIHTEPTPYGLTHTGLTRERHDTAHPAQSYSISTAALTKRVA